MSFVIFIIFFPEADLRHVEVGRGRELPSPLATVWVGNDQALAHSSTGPLKSLPSSVPLGSQLQHLTDCNSLT